MSTRTYITGYYQDEHVQKSELDGTYNMHVGN
jgi:hypothetical protein